MVEPHIVEAGGWSLNSWPSILLITNAVLGIVLLEYTWAKTERFRNPIPEVEAKMKAFKRNDASRWSKWKLYPGAMTVLIPRLLAPWIGAIPFYLLIKLFLIG